MVGAAIGCVLAIASTIQLVWFRTLPFPASDRLVRVYESRRGDTERYPTTYGNLREWRPDAALLESVGAYAPADPRLVETPEPRVLTTDRITAPLLGTLGLRPERGRTFHTDEVRDSRVVILSYRTWVEDYGQREDVVGSSVRMDGVLHTIVGVAPRELSALLRADVFTPLSAPPEGPGDRVVRTIGRLKPGASVAASQRGMAVQVRALEGAAVQNGGFDGAEVVPLREVLVGNLTPTMAALTLVAAFLLLVTAANVIGLRLANAERERQATAVKLALGATKARLLRESAVAVLMSAIASAVTAVLLSQWPLSTVRYLSKRALLETELSLGWDLMTLGALAAVAISALAEAYYVTFVFRADPVAGLVHHLPTVHREPRRRMLAGTLVFLQAATATTFAVVAIDATSDV